jgi:hypothetical protein
MQPATFSTPDAYELRYTSLLAPDRALSFPCDAAGRVDLDRLSERARNTYFYVRRAAGREFSWPAVQPHHVH